VGERVVAGYFITGTDTGVGKTLIACALLRALSARGLRAAGYKPVSAGLERVDGRLVNEDVERLRSASCVELSSSEACAYLLAQPLAPHIAAADEGIRLELARMLRGFEALASRADAVVVEGVGGLLVPLGEDEAGHEDAGDLAAELGLPVVLVVGLRLGCLNHALLTAEAIARRGLPLAGWVGNRIDPKMARVEENIEALTRRLHGPCLGVVPWLQSAVAQERERAALACLDLRFLRTTGSPGLPSSRHFRR
jgi:dethiobiotin synthetase